MDVLVDPNKKTHWSAKSLISQDSKCSKRRLCRDIAGDSPNVGSVM